MTKEHVTATATEEIFQAEDDGTGDALRHRIDVAIQRCWRDDMGLEELVQSVRRKLRNGFDGWAH
ncbi:MAG TPA: hypothetical protein VGH62_04085 [Bradyrhizobium sp.]